MNDRYYVNGQIYSVSADRLDKFMSEFPNATKISDNFVAPTKESAWEREFRESGENISNALSNIIPDLNLAWQSTKAATMDLIKPIFSDKKEDEIDEWIVGQYGKIEKLKSQRADTGEGIYKGIKQGDISDVVGGIANAFTGVATTLIPAVFTRGMSIYPQIMAPMITDYNVEKARHLYGDDPDAMKKLVENEETDFVLPAVVGFAAARMEKFGLKGIQNYIAKNATRGRGAAMLLTTGLRESGTELGQFAAETTNRRLAEGANALEATWDGFVSMWSDDGIESALQGFVGGAGIAGGGRIVNRALRNDAHGQKFVAQSLRDLSTRNIKRGFTKPNSSERTALDIEIKTIEDNLRKYLLDNRKVGELLNNDQKTELQNLIIEKDKIRSTLKGLKSEFDKGEITQQSYGGRVKGVVARYGEINDRISKIKSEVDITQYETQKKAVEEGAKVAGQKVQEIDKDEKAKLLKEQGYKGQELTSLTDDVAGMYNPKDKTLYLDKETALEVGEINVAGHELLHPVFNKLIGDDAAQGKIVEDFKKQLTQDNLDTMEVEMASRGYGINSGKYNTEYINVFSDSITKNKVKFNDTVYNKIGNVITGLFKGVGFKNISFDSGRGVYNFLKAYHQGLDTGKFDQDVLTYLEKTKGMKDKLAGKGQLSRVSPLEEINTLVPNTIKTKADYEAFIANPKNNAKMFESIYNPGGVINNYIRSRQTSQQEGDKTIENTIDRILNFNPEATRADGSVVGIEGFGEAIFANTRFAKLDARKDLAIETERQKMEGGDMEVATKVVAQEKADDTLDKPKTETKPTQVKSDPTKFDGVPKNLSLKSKPDTNLNVKEIDKKYTGEVGEQIFNISSDKITKPANNLTLQEARTIQQFFGKSDNLNRFIKILPPFNVATNVTQIGLEKLDVPKNIKGVSLGITKTIQDLFYENYVDPKGEMTTPGGRSKGATSQTQVKRLKPEFRGTITKETLDNVRSKIGITPRGELNVLPKGAERSSIGQSLKGMAKLFSQLTATTLVRKGSPKATAKELIPSKAGLRDAQFSTANRDLAKKLGQGENYYEVKDVDSAIKYADDIIKHVIPIFKDHPGLVSAALFYTNISIPGIPRKINKKKNPAYYEIRDTIKNKIEPEFKKLGITYVEGTRKNKYARTKFDTKFLNDHKNNPDYIAKVNKRNVNNFTTMWKAIAKGLRKPGGKEAITPILHFLSIAINEGSHPHRAGAELVAYDLNELSKPRSKQEFEFEHALQNANAFRLLLEAAANKNEPDFNKTLTALKKNYKLIALGKVDERKITKAGLKETMDADGKWNIFDNKWWERYFNTLVAEIEGGIDPFNLQIVGQKQSLGEVLRIDNAGNKISNDAIHQLVEAKNLNNKILPKETGGHLSTDGQIEKMQTIDKAFQLSRSAKTPVKGMSVIDFDDTLATTTSKINYTIPRRFPDGRFNPAVVGWGAMEAEGKLTPAEFAQQHEQLTKYGAEFDYSEFTKVKGGKKGPFFNKAKALKKKFGNNDIFILSARPAEAAPAIAAFLKGVGLDIKVENIIGLENGKPQAKADWMVGMAAKGYNDILFADDQIKNVKAVKQALDIIDVKSKTYEVKMQFSKNASKDFNKILEDKTGVKAEARFSDAAAKTRGAKSLPWYKRWFIPPSAEDFTGLLYHFAGKGKKGEAHMKFFKEKLIDPFARAYKDINAAKQVLANEFDALQKQYPKIKKLFKKDTGYNQFTNEQAIRVYLWDKNGIEIPGISKRDLKALTKIVEDNAEMKVFADKLGKITKLSDGYIKPSNNWTAETIGSDIINISNKVNRSKYMKEFTENKELIFSDKNMNKIEAIYGTAFRNAMQDILTRMETGKNRQAGKNKLVNAWTNWVNNSVGAIMFLNMRSAVLQTISAFNFVNWSDNNPLKAGMAVANFPQFAKDFSFIFNSDTLKQRRAGLQTDVNAAELAESVAGSKNKVNATIAYLLKKGFLPTQIADSFAIASGGASFYRNRINTYTKQGLSKKEAESKAWNDFQEISEASQQSARPDLISEQQAGPLGRLVLAFQNTPMQYTRLMKKAFLDLKNRRGDDKTNISKILYYGAVQNFVFNAMQSALFGLMFEDEDEKGDDKYDKKKSRVLNNMADTILRGVGVYGAAVATIKNVARKFAEQDKKGYRADHAYTMLEAINLSPPIGSKARKIYGATQTWKFNRDEIMEKGLSLDSPAYGAVGNVISASTNIPLDRVYNKLNNVGAALDKNNAAWQRVATALGWNTWDVGVQTREEFEKTSKEIKKENQFLNEDLWKHKLKKKKRK